MNAGFSFLAVGKIEFRFVINPLRSFKLLRGVKKKLTDKMAYFKVRDPVTNGFITISKVDDVEYIDPTNHFKKIFVDIIFNGMRTIFELKHPEIPQDIVDNVVGKLAQEEGEKNFNKILLTPVPNVLFAILESSSKKEQKKILKGLKLTNEEFISFICKAWSSHGFSFSNYHSEHFPKGLDKNQMPRLAIKDNNNDIKSVGKTSWTSGQIKSAIAQRSVVVSKFLDKGDKWHCFFITYNSLKGAEKSYKDGQPHFHYISHAWGLTREYVLAQLKCKEYNLPSYHLDFIFAANCE